MSRKSRIIVSVPLVLALFVFLAPLAIFGASDITNAEWRAKIVVSNNGAAASDVSTNFTLSTSEMITAGMLNSNAADAAITTAGGTDVAFMPSVGSNPWCAWVSSIDASSMQNLYLYTGNVTGGKICYFPGDGGMTISDDASMEPSDNFSIEVSGWFDTSASAVGEFIISKGSDFRVWVGGAGNITSGISEGAASEQQSFTTGDDDALSISGSTWIGQTFTTSEVYKIDDVRIKAYREGSPGTLTISIRATSGGLPTGDDLTSGNIDANTFTTNTAGSWYTIDVTDTLLDSSTVYAIVCRAPGGSAGNLVKWRRDNEAGYADGQAATSVNSGESWSAISTVDMMFKVYGYTLVSVSATDVSSGEFKLEVYLDASGNLTIEIDDIIKDTAACGAVLDNDADWIVGDDDVTPYIEEFALDVGGTNVCSIVWEYDTTFYDTSGFGNDATPTFRTTSSDADVSAYISEQTSLVTTESPSPTSLGGWTMITEVPDEPTGIYDEGGTSFPWGTEIEEMADNMRLPKEVFLFPLAFGSAILLGGTAFGLTHRQKMGIKGSLLIMCFVIEGVLIVWYSIGGGVIPGWTLIPFGIAAVLLLLWKNPYNPTA